MFKWQRCKPTMTVHGSNSIFVVRVTFFTANTMGATLVIESVLTASRGPNKMLPDVNTVTRVARNRRTSFHASDGICENSY